MFQRVFHESWVAGAPFVAFILIAGVFAVATVRALRMDRRERERLASLPLQDAPDSQP